MRIKRKSIRPAVFYSIKDVFAHKKTIVLTVFVLAFSFLLILFSRFIIYGFERTLENSIINISGDLALVPLENKNFLENVSIIEKKIRKINGVQATASRISYLAKIKYHGKLQRLSWSQSGAVFFEGMPVPDRLDNLSQSMIRGEYFKSGNDAGIILGKHVAEDIEKQLKEKIKLGDKMILSYQKGSLKMEKEYFVRGIIDSHNYVINESILLSKGRLERLLGAKDVASVIAVKINSEAKVEQIKKELQKLDIKAQIKSWKDFDYMGVSDIVRGVRAIGNIIFIVSLLSAAMIIGIIIYLNVLSKKRQIAIVKAIGTSSTTIVSVFIAESLLFTFLGMMLGTVFYLALYKYLLIHPISLPFGPVVPVFNLSACLIAVCLFLIVVILSAFYPAHKISKQSIVKAIWQIG